eukprot:TRINITY_DN9516_c0_g1_i2.p1 TRINITY_DN9516_c0_g1~~TRINITY_DN9516_c0_g1_i2.p1  ORF type:complete len:377 (+),score=58.27 TRINITY_DN9516_c0_g1_i2:753-1883(+)
MQLSTTRDEPQVDNQPKENTVSQQILTVLNNNQCLSARESKEKIVPIVKTELQKDVEEIDKYLTKQSRLTNLLKQLEQNPLQSLNFTNLVDGVVNKTKINKQLKERFSIRHQLYQMNSGELQAAKVSQQQLQIIQNLKQNPEYNEAVQLHEQQIIRKNENNQHYRILIKEKEKGKFKAKQTIHAMKLALEYLLKVKVTPSQLLTKQVFSTIPFQKEGSRILIQAAKHGKQEIVEQLLKQNEYLVFDFDNIFMTSLHWASKRGHANIVQLLMEYGADVDATDIIGRSPLYFAIQSQQIEIVHLLLKNKASPWAFSKSLSYTDLCKNNGNYSILNIMNKFRQIHIILKLCKPQIRNELWKNYILIVSSQEEKKLSQKL